MTRRRRKANDISNDRTPELIYNEETLIALKDALCEMFVFPEPTITVDVTPGPDQSLRLEMTVEFPLADRENKP